MVAHVEILVEEPSMEAALRLIVPRIIGDVSFEVYPHQGKRDLLDKLPARLRGYAAWLPQDWRIMAIVDRDDEDCRQLKHRMEKAAARAGLSTRSGSRGPGYQVVNRLAIEELEAWFFDDWEAVRAAYPAVSAQVPNQRAHRDPDAIQGGTWEALERILKRAGYFRSGLRKIEAARAIAGHMDPERNRSGSFWKLRAALSGMTSSGSAA
jgi:hypothetical protein